MTLPTQIFPYFFFRLRSNKKNGFTFSPSTRERLEIAASDFRVRFPICMSFSRISTSFSRICMSFSRISVSFSASISSFSAIFWKCLKTKLLANTFSFSVGFLMPLKSSSFWASWQCRKIMLK